MQQDHLEGVAIANGVIAMGSPGFVGPGSVYVYSWRDGRTVATYCRPSPSPLPDCQPEISFLGAPSASGNATFELRSGRLPGEQFGMFLYSHSSAAPSPLESAGLCLPQGTVLRSGVLWSGGTLGQCNGGFALDWNELVQQSASADPLLEVPGTLVRGQFAYFPLLGAGPSGLSDAVIFTLCP